MFLHVVEHTLEDTLRMLPFLYLAYLFIEFIERRQGQRIERALAGGGRWGVIPGALLGCVPQCGFSAMAANLYGGRVITLGTLMAVFLATSDEAVPLLLAMPDQWPALAGLLAVKIVWALAAGIADEVELQLAYAIGVARPVSVFVETFGTGKLPDDAIAEIVKKEFDLRPAAIIAALSLNRPAYRATAAYGHFGRAAFTWEQTDRAEDLKKYLK